MRVTSNQVASFSVIGVSIRLRIEKVGSILLSMQFYIVSVVTLVRFQFDALLRLCVNKAKREVWSERVVSILEPRAHWQLQVSLWAEAKLTPASIQLHLTGPLVSLLPCCVHCLVDVMICTHSRPTVGRRWARPTTSTSSPTSPKWRRLHAE